MKRTLFIPILFNVTVSFCQFPLNTAATGDTIYSDYSEASGIYSTPWGLDGQMIISSVYHTTSGSANDGALLLIMDTNGNILSDPLLTDENFRLRAALATPEGVYLAGERSDQSSFLAKLTEDLQSFEWIHPPAANRRYTRIERMSNGDILALGTRTISWNELSPIVHRITANGEIAGQCCWGAGWNTNDIEYARSAQELSDGRYIITGSSGPAIPSLIDVLCISAYASGELIERNILGSGGFQTGLRVLPSDGDNSTIWASQDGSVAHIFKVTNECQVIWSMHHGIKINDVILDTTIMQYVAVGRRNGFPMIAKFDMEGDTLWSRTPPVLSGIEFSHLRQDGFGGYIITGDKATGLLREPYQIRLNGEGFLTSIESITNRSGDRFVIQPNPSFNDALIISENQSEGILWELYDDRGRRLRTGSVSGNRNIVLSRDELTAGVYYVRISIMDRIEVVKWVVL